MKFDIKDVRIEAFRQGPSGGMRTGSISADVKVTHLPTGIEVVCSMEISHHKNRTAALKQLQELVEAL
jgi:protein subunit release factor A